MTHDVRLTAVNVLQEVLSGNGTLDDALNRAQGAQDQSLLKHLCYSVVRNYHSYLLVLDHLMKKPLPDKHRDLKLLIMLGMSQLIDSRVPDHAAVYETVQAADGLGKGWGKRLVNGVLRNYLRSREQIAMKLGDMDEYRFAHPGWLVEMLRSAWPQKLEDIIEANNQSAPMTLRINLAAISRDLYMERFDHPRVKLSPGPMCESAVVLSEPIDVDDIYGFRDGLVSVQDESSQLAAELLDLQPRMRVLDGCAAPGGKTCHILEREKNLSLIAVEKNPSRSELIVQNLSRLKMTCTVTTDDVLATESWWDSQFFDRILIDVPCSATGVIRRHPDIKILRKPEDIAKLAEQQKLMIDKLWQLLKPGGLLVYSTCSILPSENCEVVRHFLDRTDDALEAPIEAAWGITVEHGRQLLPKVGGHDGFYYARLQKRAP